MSDDVAKAVLRDALERSYDSGFADGGLNACDRIKALMLSGDAKDAVEVVMEASLEMVKEAKAAWEKAKASSAPSTR